jgi:hypothetical protein
VSSFSAADCRVPIYRHNARGDTSRWMLLASLPTFMLRDQPDPVWFLKVLDNLYFDSRQTVKGKQARVAILEKCVISGGHKVPQRRRFRSKSSATSKLRHAMWTFCPGILSVTYRAGWTAISSIESAQDIQPFIPDKSPCDVVGELLFLPCRPCRSAA